MSVSGRRLRLIRGEWIEDARRRQTEFFGDATLATLPDPELGVNPFLALVQQIATLFDRQYAVRIAGSVTEDDRAAILTPRLRPLQQALLETVVALREGLMRVDWLAGAGAVSYRPVEAAYVGAIERRPGTDELTLVHEWQLRQRATDHGPRDVWVREVWDVRDPTAPSFRIEEWASAGGWLDVTAEFVAGPPGYPYYDTAGRPILPYALYHARVGTCPWSPSVGEELVLGTLSTSALWTFWLGGVRDASHPQRAVINGKIVGLATRGQGAVQVAEISPLTILQIKSDGVEGTTPSIAQWTPGMDPKATAEALQLFVQQIALFAGVSPADVSVGSAGLSRVSGLAIVISREGQRRARETLRPAIGEGDRVLLSIAARLANHYGGTSLPESPSAYEVIYPEPERTSEEERAELDRLDRLLERGQISRVDYHMAVRPDLDRSEAFGDLVRITVEGAALQLAIDAQVAEAAPEAESAVALNGAQVTAALAIVESVAAGRLPRESAVQMLVSFFLIPAPVADALLGTVGTARFTPSEAVNA